MSKKVLTDSLIRTELCDHNKAVIVGSFLCAATFVVMAAACCLVKVDAALTLGLASLVMWSWGLKAVADRKSILDYRVGTDFVKSCENWTSLDEVGTTKIPILRLEKFGVYKDYHGAIPGEEVYVVYSPGKSKKR